MSEPAHMLRSTNPANRMDLKIMRYGVVLIGLVVVLSNAAMAEPTRDEVLSAANRCAGISDNRTWLDCFYGSAQPMRALLGLPPAPLAQTKLVPPPGAAYIVPNAASSVTQKAKPSSFLADIFGSSKPVASNVPMASYKFGRNGTFTVVLANGQTYRQEESDLVFAKWTRPANTYLVTITGASDSFVLRVKDEPGVLFHVRRVTM